MPQSAYSSGRGQDNGYGPWVPKEKKSELSYTTPILVANETTIDDPAREAEQQRKDDIDSRKRMERREKERKEAERRNPQNNEPRVTGDPRGLWSQPPTGRGSSYKGSHSSPYNNPYWGSQNNSPYTHARSSSNNPYSNPYSTSKSSHDDRHYESDKRYYGGRDNKEHRYGSRR